MMILLEPLNMCFMLVVVHWIIHRILLVINILPSIHDLT